MSIRHALNSIPSKPGVVLAIIGSIVVLSIFYFRQYQSCTDIASLRMTLHTGIQHHADGVIRLSDITPFEWEKARIILNHQSQGKVLDCSFGWDWTEEKRKRLMAAGQLNVIAFARKGVNTVVDFSLEEIDFNLSETVFTPDSAVFRVEKKRLKNNGYVLIQVK